MYLSSVISREISLSKVFGGTMTWGVLKLRDFFGVFVLLGLPCVVLALKVRLGEGSGRGSRGGVEG